MAGIIKANAAKSGERGVQGAAFNFHDMSDRANAYLENVRRQAAQIVAQAQEEAAQVRRQAEEDGRQAAEQAAQRTVLAQLDKQLQTLLPALGQAIDGIQQAKQAWMQRWEENAIRLAVAIAGRLVRRELSQSPEITLQFVREALELAAGSNRVKLHLNPQDYQALGEQTKKLALEIGELAPADIVADATVSPGGCRVFTEFGEIDQRIETQLARIEQELT
jgi:flagellar assembly protein FliH